MDSVVLVRTGVRWMCDLISSCAAITEERVRGRVEAGEPMVED